MTKLIYLILSFLLVACGGGGGERDSPTPIFTVGGGLTGLGGSTGLILRNGSEALAIGANSTTFAMATNLERNSYNITVDTQPVGKTCMVNNGVGTIGASTVSNVAVVCSPYTYTVSGAISGLGSANGLQLSNGVQTLAVTANQTGFAFANGIVEGAAYSVLVQTQPAGLTCSVANGIGTMGSSAVTNISITCSVNSYILGGNISGFITSGLVLTIGSQTVGVQPGSTNFVFASPIAYGTSYNAKVQTQPSGQTCSVSNGVGVVSSASSNSIAISCDINGPTVSTTAGTGAIGFVNGIGTAASFNYPAGVAVDSSGNTFVAEVFNHVIRKITPAGVVSTFAGNGFRGFTDGAGTGARLYSPRGVALDSLGNLIVADSGNHAIRTISPEGIVSTLAGIGSTGLVNGVAAATSFSYPGGVAVDNLGNIIVADSGNHAIRKITPEGVVSTLAGTGLTGFANGAGPVTSFNYPVGVAVDSGGNVFVADSVNNVIRRITPDGVVSTFAGSGSADLVNGVGTAASFYNPLGVAVDVSGSIIVADSGHHVVRKITPVGVVSTLAGTGAIGFTSGVGTVSSFNYPGGVAVDRSGRIFVGDGGNHAIRKITP